MKQAIHTQNIIIDLEFTPVPKGHRLNGLRNEIIQIGAVRMDASGQAHDSFSCYVAPELVESLPRNIINLTGIRDCDLVKAPKLEEALSLLAQWIGCASSTRIVAWSGSDKKQVLDECAAKGLLVPELGRWMDLQKVFPRIMEIGKRGGRMGLRQAYNWCGIEIDRQRQHGALYDAECTAELLTLLLTGEYLEYKASMAAVMPQRGVIYKAVPDGPKHGVMADALAALYQQMTAGAVVAAA